MLRYSYVACLFCLTIIQCGGDANQNIAVYDFYQLSKKSNTLLSTEPKV